MKDGNELSVPVDVLIAASAKHRLVSGPKVVPSRTGWHTRVIDIFVDNTILFTA